MSTRYPDSICEAHLSVRTSEPVCIVCMGNQIADLQSQLAAAERSLDRHRADAERKRWLVASEVSVARMKDTGLFMMLDGSGYPLNGGEYGTADEAIDAAAALSPTVSEGAGKGTYWPNNYAPNAPDHSD